LGVSFGLGEWESWDSLNLYQFSCHNLSIIENIKRLA
jgi:hypothetical protein